MCGINCLQSKWTPAIFPEYRAPKRAGWTIAELPDGIPDQFRRGWTLRKPRSNRNGHEAVEEALIFLHNNHVTLTSDIRHSIENQADYEWCGYEPQRCRHRAKVNAAGAPRAPDVVIAIVKVQQTPKKAVAKASSGKAKCCGG